MRCQKCDQSMMKAGFARWLKAGQVRAVQKYKCNNSNCQEYLKVKIIQSP